MSLCAPGTRQAPGPSKVGGGIAAMATDSDTSGSAYSDTPGSAYSPGCVRTCEGDCLNTARAALQQARHDAASLGRARKDIERRFDYLRDICGNDRHTEAEIDMEQTLALYEALLGQEHPEVAQRMLELAAVQKAHGNASSASYLTDWAENILRSPKEEPSHEFFHLVGWQDQPQA
jgi:hypothetical protein